MSGRPAADGASEECFLNPELAAVLSLTPNVTRLEIASRLAEIAGLPAPRSRSAALTLSEIVLALESRVVVEPAMLPMDRALVAELATGVAAERVGEVAILETLKELGPESLDENVRAALYETIAPALAERGVIRLQGG